MLAGAQTALMEGKSIDNAASMQRLDGYLKVRRPDRQRAQDAETSPVGKPLFEAALAAYDVYQRDAITPMVAAIRAGKAQEARQAEPGEGHAAGRGLHRRDSEVWTSPMKWASAWRAKRPPASTVRWRSLVAALAVVAALVVGVYAVFARAVFRPLHEAGRLFDSIAGGDLTNRVEQRANNEIGILYAAVKRMQDSLARTVSAVRHGVEKSIPARARSPPATSTCPRAPNSRPPRWRNRRQHGRTVVHRAPQRRQLAQRLGAGRGRVRRVATRGGTRRRREWWAPCAPSPTAPAASPISSA